MQDMMKKWLCFNAYTMLFTGATPSDFPLQSSAFLQKVCV